MLKIFVKKWRCMPEIGECYSVAKKLNEKIPGKTILKIDNDSNFLKNIKNGDFNLKGILNSKITKVKAYGKSILFLGEINKSKYILVSQLGMTGAWFLNDSSKDRGHFHLKFLFKEGSLNYSDPRRFGKIGLYFGEDFDNILSKIIKEKKWGIDPIISSTEEIYNSLLKLEKSNQEIKTKLLEQNLIFGIGNYLASEVLFSAKLAPKRKCSSLSKSDFLKLAKSIKKWVHLAFDKNGFSFAGGYILPDGSLGSLQKDIQIYGKVKGKCPICKENIQKEYIKGRSTYFCKKCQI